MFKAEYPGYIPHSIWMALLATPNLKTWKKRLDRWHIGTKRFSVARGLAEKHRSEILEEEERFLQQVNAEKLDRAVRAAKREIYDMSIRALVNIEQRAYDDVMELINPTPLDYPEVLCELDSLEGFIAKVANGFYNHRERDWLTTRQIRAMPWSSFI